MFDVAFSELLIIAIVALLVIGPEKLPKVARTVGSLAGRLQRYMTSVKADIEREIQFEDLQKLQQEIKQGVDEARGSVTSRVDDIEHSIGGIMKPLDKPVIENNTASENTWSDHTKPDNTKPGSSQ